MEQLRKRLRVILGASVGENGEIEYANLQLIPEMESNPHLILIPIEGHPDYYLWVSDKSNPLKNDRSKTKTLLVKAIDLKADSDPNEKETILDGLYYGIVRHFKFREFYHDRKDKEYVVYGKYGSSQVTFKRRGWHEREWKHDLLEEDASPKGIHSFESGKKVIGYWGCGTEMDDFAMGPKWTTNSDHYLEGLSDVLLSKLAIEGVKNIDFGTRGVKDIWEVTFLSFAGLEIIDPTAESSTEAILSKFKDIKPLPAALLGDRLDGIGDSLLHRSRVVQRGFEQVYRSGDFLPWKWKNEIKDRIEYDRKKSHNEGKEKFLEYLNSHE